MGLPRNSSRPDLYYDLCSVPRNDGTHRSVIARRLHVVMGPGKGYRRRGNLFFVDTVQQLWDCHGTHQDRTYIKICIAFLARTVPIGASLRGGSTWLWVQAKATADAAISSLSIPFNNYGIATELIKTGLIL